MLMLENQAVVLRLIEEYFNQKDETVWAELVHPDVLIYEEAVTILGAAEANAFYMSVLFHAFPDFYIGVDEIITAEDKVVLRSRESGTMTGKLRDRPPTGRPFTIHTTRVCRLVSGKVIELLRFRDTGMQLHQLGLLETSEETRTQLPQPSDAK